MKPPTAQTARTASLEDRPMVALALDALKTTSDRRHDERLIHAGAVRLAHAIRPFRVLQKDALQQVAGAARWHAVAFQQALDAAVAHGLLEPLPFGFYQERSRDTGE
jgi:hypothetical protein